jgi:hypothetical protein
MGAADTGRSPLEIRTLCNVLTEARQKSFVFQYTALGAVVPPAPFFNTQAIALARALSVTRAAEGAGCCPAIGRGYSLFSYPPAAAVLPSPHLRDPGDPRILAPRLVLALHDAQDFFRRGDELVA